MDDAAPDSPGFETPFPHAPILCAERAPAPEWIDFNDHMNIGYYLLAFDQAVDAFFERWMDLNASYAARTGMGSFVLQSHMHFITELRLGERFRVTIQLLDCDAKRWHYVLSMRASSDDRLCATCEQIAMNVDHATRRSAPLPQTHRRRLEALLDAHRALPRPDVVGAPLGIRRKREGS